jgi:hypothetical protein
MTTEAQMVTLLEPLVGKRFFDMVAPDKTKLPYATWIQVGGKSTTFLEGKNAGKQAARIQINVWAKTSIEAKAIINQMSDVIVADPLVGEPQGGPRGAYSNPANLRGMVQDFMIWFNHE